jgi:formate--tetrahydrofolate ligase
VSLAEHFAKGGEGAKDLASKVIAVANDPSKQGPLTPLYRRDQSVAEKVEAVARKAYGADGVSFEPAALRDIARIRRQKRTHLPICIAKTQNSLSDNPRLLGRPTGFEITVRRILLNSGAGFLVVLTGDIMRMPGLPKRPAAEDMDVVDGRIEGIS